MPDNARETTASRPPSRRTLALGVVVLLVAGAAGGYWWFGRGLPDNVALQVGDDQVAIEQLDARITTVEALYGVTKPEGDEERDEFRRAAAHSYAMAVVLQDEASEADVEVSETDVDRAMDNFIVSYFGEGEAGRSGYVAALGEAQVSEQSVRDEVRRQLEIDRLFAQVTGDLTPPSDAEVDTAYEERRCTLELPEQRRLFNIVVAKRQEARQVLRRLRAGDDFAAVAAALSIDGATRDRGGDLGMLAAADLDEAYAGEAFGAVNGELFGPVRTEHGWNVGLVGEVRAARIPPLDEVRDVLRSFLLAEERSEVWRDWLREALEDADVTYADDYAPDDPMALPADELLADAEEPAAAEKDC